MNVRKTAGHRILDAALAYAKRGWRVFPCKPRTKTPLTRHGFKDASTELETIVAWWRRWPDANVAIATGAVSGVVVLDVDPRNGGDESLTELERAQGPLESTMEVITGGGGRHFFFVLPEGSSVSSGKVANGLDRKGDGGYVMAAPSVHPSGQTYRWTAARVPLAACPAWLATAKHSKKSQPPDAAESHLGKAFAAIGLLGRLLDDGKRTVVCPWDQKHTAGKHHDTSTVIFPAREAGGLGAFHCSHSHCEGRSAADALRELDRRVQAGDAKTAWQAGLRRTQKGELRPSFANVVLILGNDDTYSGRLRCDEMRGSVELDGAEVADATVSGIRVDLEQRYALQTGDAEAARAVQFVATRNGFHPVRDFLGRLSWDRVARLRGVARAILDVRADTDDELEMQSLLVARWFISLVARPLSPGCKVDTALILQGEQGVGKSSFFRAVAGEWFSDTEMAPGDKDAMMQLRGAWIYEWAELENVTGRHEVARVKAFLSSTEDRYRPPFGRAPISVKRSGVIVGTTNREEFLHDPSGSRRFWVVSVGKLNLERLRTEREQLLAEAVAAHRAGQPWWLTEDEEKRRSVLVARFAEADPWEEAVLAYAERQTHVRTADVLADVLQIPIERRDRKADMRVAAVLRRHGYLPRQTRLDGAKGRFWCRRDR